MSNHKTVGLIRILISENVGLGSKNNFLSALVQKLWTNDNNLAAIFTKIGIILLPMWSTAFNVINCVLIMRPHAIYFNICGQF